MRHSEKKNWIEKAVNPEHKGDCTPLSNPKCTGHRRALALHLKKGDLHRESKADGVVAALLEYSDICQCGHLESLHHDWTGPCKDEHCACRRYQYPRTGRRMEDCGDCDEEDPDYVPCPQCGGDGMELGALGRRKHYRCRQCGWTFSQEAPTGPKVSAPN